MFLNKLFAAVLALLYLPFLPLLAQAPAARPLRDTLTLQLGGQNRIIIPVQDVRNLEDVPNLNGLLGRLTRDLGTLYNGAADPGYTSTVIYQEGPNGERALKINGTTTERLELRLNRRTGTVERRQHPDSVVVALENQRLVLFVLDSVAVLRELAGRDLDALLPMAARQITEYLEERARKKWFPYKGSYQSYYDPGAGDGQRLHMNQRGHHRNDYLRLNINMGAGLFRDKLVPEIGGEVAFVFGDRRYLGFTTTLHYFFERLDDGTYRTAINTFANVEYAQSFPFRGGKLWQKFSVGYLVGRQGNYFDPGTIKASLSLGTKKSEGLHVIPELIIMNNLRRSFPALRVGIGF